MIPILLIASEVTLLSWLILGLLKYAKSGKNQIRNRPEIPNSKVLSLCDRFGRNTNSFMILYPGFQYFESSSTNLDGVIAYVDTGHAWVIASEPLAETRESQLKLLDEFAQEASIADKRVLLVPSSREFAEAAEEIGFEAVLIGSEPTFILDRYSLDDKDWPVPAARQLAAKGATVKEFRPEELPPHKRSELDEMLQAWLRTRKRAALGFLNQVHPWLWADRKKYFVVEQKEKVLAFLAAIPIPAEKGWYLVDMIRSPDSPKGSIELLLLAAMREMKNQGAHEATLGVAPLSGLEHASSIPITHFDRHTLLYRILSWIFTHGNTFYNFKPLFTFKMKFQPTSIRPVFLLVRAPKKKSQNASQLAFQDIVSLSKAWLPHGIGQAAGSGILKLLSRLSLPDFIKSQLRPDTIVRSVPPSWIRLLYRLRFTILLAFLNIALYLATTDSDGYLLSAYEDRWAYSWNAFIANPVHSLALSPFLHWNPLHLLTNLFCLILFTGGLEYLAGSRIAALSYLIPGIIANPLLSVIFLSGLKMIFPMIEPGSPDVGASLGIFGTAGALYWFLRNGKLWFNFLWLIVGAAYLVGGHWEREWVMLNHWVAMSVGVILGKILLGD